MGEIIGWIAWVVVAFFAVTFVIGLRRYEKSGHGFQWATATQAMFFCIIAVLFLLYDWNKLHIIWVAPLSFVAAIIIFGGVPFLLPLVMLFTKMFVSIILIGVKKPNTTGQNNSAV